MSKVNEVHRLAKAGEYVRVINAQPSGTSTIQYENGYILKITKVEEGEAYYGPKTFDYLDDWEYNVLGNYTPESIEKTPLSEYTIQEISAELLRRYGDS